MSADLGAAYQAMRKGIEPSDPAHRRVALLVGAADPALEREDTNAAVGLGRQLARLGLGVRLVTQDRWYGGDYVDDELLVALLPSVNVRRLPPGSPVLAWIRSLVPQWSEIAALDEFSAVLASSELSRDHIAERFDGPLGLLPIAVDEDVFGAGGGRLSRVRSLLPARLQRPKLTVERIPNPDLGWGIHTPVLFDALADGSPVATNSRLGLRELGLDRVPTYGSAAELAKLVSRAGEGELNGLAAELRQIVQAQHTYTQRAASFVEFATEHSLWTSPAPVGRVINFFPDWSKGNPFQRMLYGRLPSDVRTMASTDAVTHLVLRDDGGDLTGQVLHVHWQDFVLQPSPNYAEASRRLREATANMTDLIDRGAKLIWTIHNRLPHDITYYFHEIELCRFLASNAHVIHVLSDQTMEAVRDIFEIDPAKVVVVEHGSYAGIYPELLDRDKARERLGLLPSERVVLFFGGLRPYKGLEALIESFGRVHQTDPSTRLLIVGQPGRTMNQGFLTSLQQMPYVTTHLGFVPDSDVHVYFRAADVQAAPFTAVLNSGSVLLGLGYGLPIVAPKLGALASLAGEPFMFNYRAGSGPELDEALRRAIDRAGDPQVAKGAVAYAEQYTGDHMSERFVREVLGRVWS